MNPSRQLPLLIPLLLAVVFPAYAEQDCARLRPQEVVACHVAKIRDAPLDFRLLATEPGPGYVLQRYQMNSQVWLPTPVVEPTVWRHPVDIYVPTNAQPGTALLVVNNSPALHDADYSPEALAEVARQTARVVVMIADVPDQPITFSDVEQPLLEDHAVAHTWATVLRDPAAAPELPLHVPMAAAASRAMDLAERTLSALAIKHFVITGASKRGWSAWLTAMADERVMAIVPGVIDVADTSEMLAGLRKRYGGSWPVALWPYQQAGVLQQAGSPGFEGLMAMMDPMAYASEPGQRLAMPKYLVSASGDDFFAPDPITDYQQRLPGQTSLRVLPNSDHAGVRQAVASTLVPALRRLSEGQPLPRVQVQSSGQAGHTTVEFSEPPMAVKMWTASNDRDRDFRYACGVRYRSQTLKPMQRMSVERTAPASGWQAQFIEAVFADGFIATSPVSVLPETFPEHPPAEQPGACRTFPAESR